MSYKPVLLLDIDGVVNACCGEYPLTWPEDTWRFTRVAANGYAWPIHYSTEVIDRINALSEDIEVRWHTTWQHDALQLGRQLGLNVFPVQPAPEYHRTLIKGKDKYLWWKMYAAVDVVNKEERPLIWCDDDLVLSQRSIIINEASDSAKLCLVNPFTNLGLTPEHFEGIDNFLIAWYSRTDN